MIKTIVTDSVFKMAAQMVWRRLQDASQSKKPVVLLLSGGSAVRVYAELVALLQKNSVDFSSLTVGLVDERFAVAQRKRYGFFGHDGSNAWAIEKTGLFAFFRARGARVETMLHGKSMEEEVENYNNKFSIFPPKADRPWVDNFQFSIGVFGIGEDGHTAGIFPTKTREEFEEIYGPVISFQSSVIRNKLIGYQSFSSRQTNRKPTNQTPTTENREPIPHVVGHHGGSEPFKDRITITPSCIAKLDHAFLIASGENKKEPLQRFSKAGIEDRYQTPAVVLKTAQNLTIVTDQELSH